MPRFSDWDVDGTPSHATFRARYEADDNTWWAVGCGHHQNAYEGALDEIDRLTAVVAERDALQAEVEELRRRKRAAEFWERLVRMVVARREWRMFYEADERGACDEVMIDYLAALQARIDAVLVWHHQYLPPAVDYDCCSGCNRLTNGYVPWPCPLVAALGVDPQKEEQP